VAQPIRAPKKSAGGGLTCGTVQVVHLKTLEDKAAVGTNEQAKIFWYDLGILDFRAEGFLAGGTARQWVRPLHEVFLREWPQPRKVSPPNCECKPILLCPASFGNVRWIGYSLAAASQWGGESRFNTGGVTMHIQGASLPSSARAEPRYDRGEHHGNFTTALRLLNGASSVWHVSLSSFPTCEACHRPVPNVRTGTSGLRLVLLILPKPRVCKMEACTGARRAPKQFKLPCCARLRRAD